MRAQYGKRTLAHIREYVSHKHTLHKRHPSELYLLLRAPGVKRVLDLLDVPCTANEINVITKQSYNDILFRLKVDGVLKQDRKFGPYSLVR